MDGSIGHRRPPKGARFRKGTSGDPNGRPRKPKPAPSTGSAFDVIVDRTLSITRDGVEREVSVEEALQHKTLQAALAGDQAARREVLKMIARREAALAKRHPRPAAKVERLDPNRDPRDADDAMLILGIACEDPRKFGAEDRYRRLLLEPWAVQAALSCRRGGSRLDDGEVSEIKRVTRDAQGLRWPRGTKS